MKNLPKSLENKGKKYLDMTDAQKTKYLDKLYNEYALSWGKIATICNTYTNKVRRDGTRLGIKSRDKGEAQSVAIKSGRHDHPTKGKGHNEETKIKISDSVADDWENMPDKKRQERQKDAKRRWDEKSAEEIQEFRRAAGDAVRKAAKEGSILEKFLQEGLTKAGYRVEFHKKRWVIRENLEIDLFLPKENIAIEVDGPSHFENIWGAENLQRNQQRDNEKNGLLLASGCVIVRVRQTKALSEKFKRDTLSKLLTTVEKISKKRPKKGERCIILGE